MFSSIYNVSIFNWCRRCHDRTVDGFTTTCAISAYYHWICEFEPCSWRCVLDTTLCDKVRPWHETGRWFSLGTLVPPPIKMAATQPSIFNSRILGSCCSDLFFGICLMLPLSLVVTVDEISQTLWYLSSFHLQTKILSDEIKRVHILYSFIKTTCVIGAVMVSVFVSSVIDPGFGLLAEEKQILLNWYSLLLRITRNIKE